MTPLAPMMSVPSLPPTTAPTRRPAPPTTINALFLGVAPASDTRTAADCGALTRATDNAFTHDGALAGATSMRTAAGAGAVNTTELGAVVSGLDVTV